MRNFDMLNTTIGKFVTDSGLKIGTPGGVTKILYLLGKNESLIRLNDALSKLI